MYHLDFDPDTNEYAQWNVGMPSDWDGGTVTAVFYWTVTGGAAGTVIWGFQGISYGDGEAIDQAWGAAQTVTDNWIDNDVEHITAATAAVTLYGTPAAGEDVQFRAYRNATGDTMAADARLIKIRVTFTRS
jgi:hypothetical protein